MTKTLNQDTLVPIGLAVMVIGGAAFWLGNVKDRLDSQALMMEQLKANNEASYKLVYEINSRLSKIEWRLETKDK